MGIGLLAIGATLAGLTGSRSDSPEGAAAQVAGGCEEIVSPATNASRSRHGRPGVVQRLVNSLRAGQTGCLRGGVYVEDLTVRRSRIGLRSYPGEHARLIGRLWFPRTAHDDLVRDLALDGRNAAELPSPTVNGNAISFVGDDVTNGNTNICFVLGSSYGRARATAIEASRIHNCGHLPANNHEHGIYVDRAQDTRIVGNIIFDNADRGIQLYPDAQHTLIERNVIDGNGEGVIFSGDEGVASNHNIVRYNVISNARVRADVESWYPDGNPLGVGNVVLENCLFGGHGRTIVSSGRGFSASSNVVADPLYADAAAGDFRIGAGSACAAILKDKSPLPAVAAHARQLP
jgi:parallel beta-helix repeat protein